MSLQSATLYNRPLATVTASTSSNSTADQITYGTQTIAGVNYDLLVVFVFCTDTTAAATIATVSGFSFTRVASFTFNGGLDSIYAFISDSLICPATNIAPQFSATGDAATGFLYFPFKVKNMAKTGSTALLQTATDSNSSGTPSVTFSSSVNTNNPTFGICAINGTASVLTDPTNWIAQHGANITVPTANGRTLTRMSGFSGTTITWGSSSSFPYGALFLELDWS